MKKQILGVLAGVSVVVGALFSVGCQKEKPYASYQLAVKYHDLQKNEQGGDLSPDQIEQLPADQRDLYRVALCLDKWLVSGGFARIYGWNPLVIEGPDLTINDQQAYNYYRNEVKRLDDSDLAKVITDAQRDSGGSGLTLTTSGSLEFDYLITGISTMSKEEYPQSKRYTVSYGPLTSDTKE